MTTTTKRFTFWLGVFFIAFALLSFLPSFNQPPYLGDPDMTANANYGRLLGLFPVNVLDNLLGLAIGIWATSASKSETRSLIFCRFNTYLFGAMALFGLFPGLKTLFGLLPMYGHDVWLYLNLAFATGYFGYLRSRPHYPHHAPLA